MLLCWQLSDKAEEKRWNLYAVCHVLLAYAFYGGVFAFIGALPFAAYFLLRTAHTNFKGLLIITATSSALIWPLLWLYLGKSQDVRFKFPFIKTVQDLFPFSSIGQFIALHPMLSSACAIGHGMIAGFLVFLLFIVATFLLHAIAMAIYRKRLTLDNFALAAIAVCFIISTYFVGFPEGDNYASRGYLIPDIVWLDLRTDFAGNSAKSLERMCLASRRIGLVREGLFHVRACNLSCPHAVGTGYGSSIMAINQGRNTSTASSSVFSNAFKDNPDLIYSIKKFVDGGKSHLVVADRQLECLGPHGPWQWQQSQPDIGK